MKFINYLYKIVGGNIMEENKEKELKEYLNKINCRGCYNHCVLTSPMCGRSNIFIKEAIEKFNNSKK